MLLARAAKVLDCIELRGECHTNHKCCWPEDGSGPWRWEVGLGETLLELNGAISLGFYLLQVSRCDSAESMGESLSGATIQFLLGTKCSSADVE